MNNRPLITLTTDFGADIPYVAAMRGVIKTICPEAELLDVTHSIRPQDVRHGAITLADVTPYFPEGSIHVVVVDPGVGTGRAIIAAEINGRFYVAPDNGLLSLLAAKFGVGQLVRIDRPDFWREPVSHTFHGRDIMAPVAAHIAGGVKLEQLGTSIGPGELVTLAIAEPKICADRIEGNVIDVDSFGNLITNINERLLDETNIDRKLCNVRCGEAVIARIQATYGESSPGDLVALVGSTGRLEIALVGGSAAESLQLGVDTPVDVLFDA